MGYLISARRFFLILGDIFLILLATSISPLIRLGVSFNVLERQTGATIFTLFSYLLMLYIVDLYNPARFSDFKAVLGRMCAAVGIAGILSGFLFYALRGWMFGRGIFIIQMVLVWVFLVGWRKIYEWKYHAHAGWRDTVIIGAGHSGKSVYRMLQDVESPYRVVGFLDDDLSKQNQAIGLQKVIGKADHLMELPALQGVKTAILAVSGDRRPEFVDGILRARLSGIEVVDMATVYETYTKKIPVTHLCKDWFLFSEGFFLVSKPYLQKMKRIVDFGLSLTLLTVTLPLVAVVGAAIRIDSPGPVFYRQERVGKGGKVFVLFKLRSMCQDAEGACAQWCDSKDARITRVGKWIRLMRFDEIPQLYNVFLGDMSLIGPRPERPEFVKRLMPEIPYYTLRHSVRPGITGWAQVNYRYGASTEDALRKLEYDLYYIKNMSGLLDLRILLKTIGVVLFGEGAR